MPATAAEVAAAAWLYTVPYQGTRPRISRSSVVPMRLTRAAAVGPPRSIEARIGADATETTTPRGRRTGSALAAKVAIVQNRSPGSPPISGRIGKRKKAAAITRIAAAMVARIRRVTLAFTGGVYCALPESTTASLPALDPGSSRHCEGNQGSQG